MDNKASKIEEMQYANLPKLIAKYSVFTFCALFFNELYNIVDTLFVSHGIGDNAMGGVSIIFPFVMIQGAVSQTIGSGAASIVSRLLGRKEYEKAGNVTVNAMFIFYVTAIVITVIGMIFINPLLKIFGATDDIMPYAKEYFTIMLIGNVFSTGFSSLIRAEGKMIYSLMIWLIPTAINIALDAVFIYGMHMGVKGAAFATVISYFSSFVMSVIFFTKISVQKFRCIKIELKTILDIITIGVPMLLQLGGISIIFVFVNKALATAGGTTSVNTFAYVSKIITFAIVPFNAVASASSPIISYNYGTKNRQRVNQCIHYSIIFCEIYSIIAWIVVFLVPEIFIKIFTADNEIISIGADALKIIAPALLFAPIVFIIGTYFQAAGKKATALFTNSLVIIFSIILIPIFSILMNVSGIYAALTVSFILSGIIALIIKMQKPNQKC